MHWGAYKGRTVGDMVHGRVSFQKVPVIGVVPAQPRSDNKGRRWHALATLPFASPTSRAYSPRIMLLVENAGIEGADGGAEAALRGLPGHFAPLGVWLAIQTGLLLLSILQVPLADQFSRPAERVALEVMLVGQVLLVGLLFPWLLRSLGLAILVGAGSWPFVQLAMVLSSADRGPALAAGAYLTLWIIILAGWRYLLTTRRMQLAGAAIVTGLSAGGPILWYLRAEFVRNAGGAEWGIDGLFGPVMGALAIVSGEGRSAWIAMGILAALTAGITLIARRRRRSAKPISNS